MPDRVIDVVAGRIGRQRQRRPWRLPWRLPQMNTNLRLAAGLATVAVIAVVGWQLLPRSNGPGGPTPTPVLTPTPDVSASPSAAPSAAALFPEWYTTEHDSTAAGILPPGSAATRAFVRGATFTVPAGWVNTVDTSEFYGLFGETPANEAEFGLTGNIAQGIFMALVDTPSGLICDAIETSGASSAALVDSLVANEALLTSERVDVTIGGLSGAQVDAHIDPAWTGSCPLGPDDPPTKDYKDYRGRFVFLDSPSGAKLMIIVDSVHAAGFEGFLAEAMPIVESFDFTP
jgi:hypothetical protein